MNCISKTIEHVFAKSLDRAKMFQQSFRCRMLNNFSHNLKHLNDTIFGWQICFIIFTCRYNFLIPVYLLKIFKLNKNMNKIISKNSFIIRFKIFTEYLRKNSTWILNVFNDMLLTSSRITIVQFLVPTCNFTSVIE